MSTTDNNIKPKRTGKCHHRGKSGSYYIGDSEDVLSHGRLATKLHGQVQLIFTSPPFPLNTKKRYGNKEGEDYKKWFASLAEVFSGLLTPTGSVVIELGNAWVQGHPFQSLLHLESLIGFVNNENAGMHLCQEIICYNPSRLPTPAQWVTIKKCRLVDSFTRLWWMAKTDYPKAYVERVLRPYSKSMKSLLKRQDYHSGLRPSQHKIGETSFCNDKGGSIMPNVIELERSGKNEPRLPNFLSISNTSSNDPFTKACREKRIQIHPARMPRQLPEFFIEFLTDPGDIVLDPFAGSNTTGSVAERMGRKWFSIEANKTYAEQAKLRLQVEKKARER